VGIRPLEGARVNIWNSTVSLYSIVENSLDKPTDLKTYSKDTKPFEYILCDFTHVQCHRETPLKENINVKTTDCEAERLKK